MIEALLFFHPSVWWWLSRRLGEEREHIADDMAAACIGAPRTPRARSTASAAACRSQAPASTGAAGARRHWPSARRLLRPAPAPSRAALAALACRGAGAGLRRRMDRPGRPDRAVRLRPAGIEALVKASGAAHVLVVDAASGPS